MGKIFLVRHGETNWNKELRYQGQKDVPLSKAGAKQAKLLADRLKKIKFDKVYSSDLKRAYQTAEIILNKKKITITKTEDLREISYGEWEGRLLKEIKTEYKEALQKWWSNPLKAKIPGGESISKFRKRVEKFYNKIIFEVKDKNFLVVSHGGPVRLLVALCLGLSFPNIRTLRVDNVSLSIIETVYYGNVLTLFNDISHLESYEVDKVKL